MYFVYILRSIPVGIFYVGHTDDLANRIREHQTGRSPFTRTRGPWELVYVEVFSTRGEAMKREREIKSRKSRRYIERLVNQSKGKWRSLLGEKDDQVG